MNVILTPIECKNTKRIQQIENNNLYERLLIN